MKFDFKHYLRIFREGLTQVVRSYPVELALAFYACIVWLVAFEAEWPQGFCRVAVAPLFFAAALAVNRLAGCGPWRRVYRVVWAPLVPLSLWSGLEAWVERSPYFISLFVLAPLALLLCRPVAPNRRFVSDTVLWLRAFLLAELFANVALGLFAAILFSTAYIFGFHGDWIEHVWTWAAIVCESLAAPVLFLMMAERWRDADISGGRILAVLLDYIVTPALLIYTAILYLYVAKIVVAWSLPEGGVAYLVFGFTIVALCVKALQLVLEKRRYDWFFDRFSLLSLPLSVLFWVGVARRIGEYGLTEARVWLVICGGVMTLCVLLFLFPRSARYRWVCALAFVVFASSAYVSALQPGRVAVRSQLNRALRVAGRLGMLDEGGTLCLDRFGVDTAFKADYRRFYEAAQYVSWHDTTAFKRFGVEMKDITGAVAPGMHDYVVYGWSDPDTVIVEAVEAVSWSVEAPPGFRTAGLGAYSSLHTCWERRPAQDSPYYSLTDSALLLHFGPLRPDAVIPSERLLANMLRQAGLSPTPAPDRQTISDAGDKILVYRDPGLVVVFSRVWFERPDSVLRIADADIAAVLVR